MIERLKGWVMQEFTYFQDSGEMDIKYDGQPAIKQVFVTCYGLPFFDSDSVVSVQGQFAAFTEHTPLIVESTKILNTDYFIGLEVCFETKHFPRQNLKVLNEYPDKVLHASKRVRRRIPGSEFATFIISQNDPSKNDYYLEVNVYFILTT